jgi:hypothetical protein
VRGAARKDGPYRDYFISTHIYAPASILTHGSLDLIRDRHVAFSTVLVGNQIEYRRFRTIEA